MARHCTMIQKATGWPAALALIDSMAGTEAGDRAYREACGTCAAFLERYRGCHGIHRGHVTAAIGIGAIYGPLKACVGEETAIATLADAMKPASMKKHAKLEKLPAPLFMRVALLVTSVMYSEKAGFKRRWHGNTNVERRYDLLTCPYVQVLTEMGCPEACRCICIQDDYAFCNMSNGVEFLRTKTLGRGGDCCDFGFRNGRKKEGSKA